MQCFRMMTAAQHLQTLLEQEALSEIPDNAFIIRSLHAQIYLNTHVQQFVNAQLRYLSCKSRKVCLVMIIVRVYLAYVLKRE